MADDYMLEDSDFEDDGEDGESSSDDEFQTFIKKQCGIVEIKNDFEDEMDQVITAHMEKLDREKAETEKAIPSIAEPPASTSSECKAIKNIEESSEEKSNEELFYDPNMDEDDQKWVDDKRREYIYPGAPPQGTSSVTSSRIKPLPNSDAVLNCPACLSLLCLDCQRHSTYTNQYRAMFVSNCNVISSETLADPKKQKKSWKRNRGQGENDENVGPVYNPVRCTVCNTEVAVYDNDEVYHFFNVIASYA